MFSPSSTLKHAPCRDLSTEETDRLFFSTSGSGYRTAKKICTGCRDKDECLEIALSFELPRERYGVWGGLSARERGRLAGDPEEEDAVQAN